MFSIGQAALEEKIFVDGRKNDRQRHTEECLSYNLTAQMSIKPLNGYNTCTCTYITN